MLGRAAQLELGDVFEASLPETGPIVIRVIEIEDFDWSPCGGTHAARTGQVGLIAVRSYERAKKMTRLAFSV